MPYWSPRSGSSATAASGPTTVKIVVGGLDKQIYLPFRLAEQLGFSKQQGLNLQLLDEPAGVDATTAMLAGQVDGVGGFYDHTIDLQGRGKSSESVVSTLQVPGEVELCRSDLKGTVNSPADWKGRKLGVTDLGSSTDFLLQWIQSHTAAQITDQMPADYYAGVGKAAYIAALDGEKGIYTPDGIMPANGPPTNLNVLSAFNPDVKGHTIDLSRTYTDQFVQVALKQNS